MDTLWPASRLTVVSRNTFSERDLLAPSMLCAVLLGYPASLLVLARVACGHWRSLTAILCGQGVPLAEMSGDLGSDPSIPCRIRMARGVSHQAHLVQQHQTASGHHMAQTTKFTKNSDIAATLKTEEHSIQQTAFPWERRLANGAGRERDLQGCKAALSMFPSM